MNEKRRFFGEPFRDDQVVLQNRAAVSGVQGVLSRFRAGATPSVQVD